MMHSILNSRFSARAILSLSFLFLFSCSTHQPKGKYGVWTDGEGAKVELVKAQTFRSRAQPAAALPSPAPYRLRAGDVLSLRVEHLTPIDEQELIIDEEGGLDLPLLGCMKTQGRSLDDLRGDLSSRYSEVFTSAKVVLRLVKRHRPTCSVLGQVGKPGLLEIDEGTTLVKAIAQAGGFRYLDRREALGASDLKRAFLSRQGGLVRVDFESLFLRGDLAQDVSIQDGDMIFVPDSSHREVVVLGAVGRPGVVPMPAGDLNILNAIGHAGGFGEYADMSCVAIIRNVESKPAIRLINTEDVLDAKEMALALENGDVVFVARDDIRALDIPSMLKTASTGLILAYGVTSFQR